jgi:hypothetical protein
MAQSAHPRVVALVERALPSIIHDWRDAEALKILASMPTAGLASLVEGILEK